MLKVWKVIRGQKPKVLQASALLLTESQSKLEQRARRKEKEKLQKQILNSFICKHI